MDYFEFIDSLFSKRLYEKVDKATKQKNFFILNRFLSNQYPIQVNDVNNLMGISKENCHYIVDHWARFLQTKYTAKPQWAWVKTTPSAQIKSGLSKFGKEVIEEYRIATGLTARDIDSISKFFIDDLVLEIAEFEKSKKTFERKNPKKK
jgi:hypothetical protein